MISCLIPSACWDRFQYPMTVMLPVYLIITACWDGHVASPSPLPSERWWGAVSGHFCNCPKLTIQHSYPLHAVTGKLCGGEKGAKVWTTLSSSLFYLLHNYVWHFLCVQPSLKPQIPSRKDCLKMCTVFQIFQQYHISSFSMIASFSLHLLFGTTINTLEFDVVG